LKFFSNKISKEKEIDFIKDYHLFKEIKINKNNTDTEFINKSYFNEKYFLFYEDPLVKIFN
jgi:hypothetical protein